MLTLTFIRRSLVTARYSSLQPCITYLLYLHRRSSPSSLHNYRCTKSETCLMNLGRIGTSSSSSNIRIGVVSSHIMASEKEAALAAVPSDGPTIFDKIINKEIPANVVFEDDKVLAFRDITPQAPTHILIIPKNRDGLTRISKAEDRHCEILGHLLYTAKLIAKQEGLADGFRIVINDGPVGGQSVYHLHVHLLGGRQMDWPPG